MDDNHRLDAAAKALAMASNLAEARRAINLWAPRFHDACGERLVAGPRPDLRMDIASMPGRGGFTARRGDSFFVAIGTQGGRERRFTLAHELAHVLINSAESGGLEISTKDEEDLCDLFARRALAPPALIRRHLSHEGLPGELADVERFAARFRISLRASLVTLSEVMPAESPVAFVAASWRGHPRRPQVKGMRIDASAADRRFFFPFDCRLSTLGYDSLEAWALTAAVGARGAAHDEKARPRSGRAGIAGWRGKSTWVAECHFAPGSRAEADQRGLLCKLDVGGLSPIQPKQRQRERSARTGLLVG